MFFLLRIGFWLTVVFLLLPAVVGGPSTHAPQGSTAQTGEPKVSAMDALSAATAAAADAGGFCTRQPQACAIGGSLIELIGERAEAGARFALSYLSEQIVEEKRKAAARSDGSRAGDTLTTHDLSPAWQGPRPPAGGAPSDITGSAGATPAAAPANPPGALPVHPATPGGVPLPPKRPA
ncbi:hypothetical protein EV667_1375 [Ancylobacter aquaticus]|uniref:DUF5330 domain-containing protein n=1 Tax=Ancylobacter aquaticus TaxID=100 RepID=A0A4R1I7A3_ANCAQ|nr:DUF5330 domain-containing protein [Ancylobacter aquaticus]TCK31267.1 hypothetical protein EV667_1375 [Ancylobacter aquaticus]